MTNSAVPVTYIDHFQQRIISFNGVFSSRYASHQSKNGSFFNFPNVYGRQNDAPSPPLSDWFSGGVSDHVFNNKAYNSCFFSLYSLDGDGLIYLTV